MTDREKIIETLRASGYGYFITHKKANADEALAYAADALIADGYGDVAEWKRRAEVAEKEREEYRRSNRIVLRGIEIIKRNIIRYCAADFPNILQQAEREIEEERK